MSSSSPTYVVVCLHEHCCQEAAQYIADRLSARPEEGGAGLVVHQAPMRPDGLVVHVSASEERILRLAEDVGVKKEDADGVVREFKVGKK